MAELKLEDFTLIGTINSTDFLIGYSSDTLKEFKITVRALFESLPSGFVKSSMLDTEAVTTDKINDGAITAVKLADQSVGTANFIQGAVDTAAIKALAIVTAKIADGAVTEPKLASESVSSRTLQEESVISTKIAKGAVNAYCLDQGALKSRLMRVFIDVSDWASSAAYPAGYNYILHSDASYNALSISQPIEDTAMDVMSTDHAGVDTYFAKSLPTAVGQAVAKACFSGEIVSYTVIERRNPTPSFRLDMVVAFYNPGASAQRIIPNVNATAAGYTLTSKTMSDSDISVPAYYTALTTISLVFTAGSTTNMPAEVHITLGIG